MIVVIIAGGSGTRLWPLSTHEYPKQLLTVNGDKRSLLQNAYIRAKKLSDTVYIVPEQRLTDHIKEQLPELPEDHYIIEPALRGTASCILAAMTYVSKRHDPDEPMAIVWADQYIRDVDGYVHSFRIAEQTSRNTGRIVLVGIEPTYPSVGLGYIRKDELLDEQNYVFNVHSFTEKPELERAKEFIASGKYLWNAGYFVASVRTLEKSLQQHSPEWYGHYQSLQAASGSQESFNEAYMQLPSLAIDYALSEKVPNLLVVPASFDWMDLGSFKDLHDVADCDAKGNYTKGNVEIEEVQNAFIENQEDKPVAVIGLDNVVVVNTPAGILVARKDLSQKVGEVSKRFKKKES
ncbi:MAG TPA: mannose-1-phosphate guanylyltransferase [Patescibacteria group bacterium]|nr:mannose-1-phosphate guanylyltransferase [Patescibacteria group bacterium]